MRLSHFESLQPICPLCCRDRNTHIPLKLQVAVGDDEWVEEGQLHCEGCNSLYPILKGIPILVPNVSSYLETSLLHVLWPQDMSAFGQQWLGECSGPGSAFELTRQYISTYAWAHYGDLSEKKDGPVSGLLDMVDRILETKITSDSPGLEIGCSVGRGVFEMAAQTQQFTLGIDVNFAMVKAASRLMRTGRLKYPRRRVGTVYQSHEIEFDNGHHHLVDFWVADALALPFKPESFGRVNSMHVLDAVTDPVRHISEMARMTANEGVMGILCPYDWSPSVTEFKNWIGGSAQMGALEGRSEDTLHWIINDAGARPDSRELEIIDEEKSLPWTLRIHNRAVMHYTSHLTLVKPKRTVV